MTIEFLFSVTGRIDGGGADGCSAHCQSCQDDSSGKFVRTELIPFYGSWVYVPADALLGFPTPSKRLYRR